MTFNNEKYRELLVQTLPRVIDSQAEYDRLETIFELMINKDRSPEEDSLFDLLANLLEEYEMRSLARLQISSPLETLKFLMTENNLKQADMTDIFGSQGVVSEVLAGKRGISKTHARKLAERFKLSVNAFI